MDKNKKVSPDTGKKKADAYDIVFRIVSALLSIAVFPVIFFMQLIEVKFSLSLVDLGMDLSDFNLSVYRIIKLYNGTDELSNLLSPDKVKNMGWPAALDPVKGRLIVMTVFLAIAVIAALFCLVWSCVSNKKRGIAIGGGAGLASVIATMITFSTVSKEFLAGNIDVISLFTESGIINLIKTLLGGSIIDVDRMALGSFANVILMLFIGLVLWVGIFALTEIGADDSAKNAPSKSKSKK